MGQWWVLKNVSNDRQRLHIAEYHTRKISEKEEKAIDLKAESEGREYEPSKHYQDEPNEKHGTSHDFTFAHEKTECVSGAYNHNETHDEGHVANTQKASIQHENDSERVKNKPNHDQPNANFLRVVVK